MAFQKKRYFTRLFDKLFEKHTVDYALTDSVDATRLYRDAIDLKLLSLVTDPPGEKRIPLVLDAGCGIGRIASILVGKGFRVVGMDVSRTALSIASRSLTRSEGLILSDVEHMPFRDDILQEIVALYLTDYIGIDEFLRECRRILQRDGKVVFTVPSFIGHRIRQRILRAINRIVKGKGRSGDTTNSYSRSEIVDAVRENGMKINTICGHEFIAPSDLKLIDRLLGGMGVPSFYLVSVISLVNSYISKTCIGLTLSQSFAVVAKKEVMKS